MWLASWLWSTQCPPCVGRGEGERRAKVFHLFTRIVAYVIGTVVALFFVLFILDLLSAITHGQI